MKLSIDNAFEKYLSDVHPNVIKRVRDKAKADSDEAKTESERLFYKEIAKIAQVTLITEYSEGI